MKYQNHLNQYHYQKNRVIENPSLIIVIYLLIYNLIRSLLKNGF
jgi:hypothetical protein